MGVVEPKLVLLRVGRCTSHGGWNLVKSSGGFSLCCLEGLLFFHLFPCKLGPIIVSHFKLVKFLQVASRDNRTTLVLHVHLNEILCKVINSIIGLMITKLLIEILELKFKLNKVIELS